MIITTMPVAYMYFCKVLDYWEPQQKSEEEVIERG